MGNLYYFNIILSTLYLFSPRDLLPSTVAPPDPRQFCIPSQFGSSALPNANVPNMLSNRVYSGMGKKWLQSVEQL